MSDQNIMARQLRPTPYKRLCDLEVPGHNKIIMPGKVAYQVTTGECQGVFHGVECFHKAREQMKEIKEKLQIENE